MIIRCNQQFSYLLTSHVPTSVLASGGIHEEYPLGHSLKDLPAYTSPYSSS